MSSGQLVVKKEEASFSFPPKRSSIDLTAKTSGSKKRKIDGVMDLSLENLGAEDIPRNLVSFSQAVGVSVVFPFAFFFLPFLTSFLFRVSDHISADVRIWDERVEQVLKEQEIMWKETNKDLLK